MQATDRMDSNRSAKTAKEQTKLNAVSVSPQTYRSFIGDIPPFPGD